MQYLVWFMCVRQTFYGWSYSPVLITCTHNVLVCRIASTCNSSREKTGGTGHSEDALAGGERSGFLQYLIPTVTAGLRTDSKRSSCSGTQHTTQAHALTCERKNEDFFCFVL